ncbi:hypothetical protein [Aquihabitans sp. McL0605]|uniref:hypothetical protein n=1 Tax=Aquihabitans sp. McL0605 TaxID=3415671 RepID=UPI003CEBD9F9
MANDRSSSKQKRARQNRAQREAREARAKAASEPASARQAKYASAAPGATTTETKKQGFLSPRGQGAAREPRRARPGDTPVDLDTLEGNWYSKRMQVPGGRQVLTGLLLVVILTVLTILSPVPIAKQDQVKGGPTTESVFDRLGAFTIPVLLLPVIAMAIAAYFITSPRRRGIWIACAVVSTAGVTFLGIPYIFPVGFLVYAGMRANKVEGPNPNSRAGRAARRAAEATGIPTVDPAPKPVDEAPEPVDDAD